MDDIIHYRNVDTQTLIVALKDVGKLPEDLSTRLHAVAEYFGIDTGKEHSAKDDTYTTIEVYKKLLDLIK